jgi:hypothetical protein
MRRSAAGFEQSRNACVHPRRAFDLTRHDEVRSAILLPALFVMVGAERAFLAPADCFHSVGSDAERNQEVLRGFCPPLAKTQVVFG